MTTPPLPPDEDERLEALHRYQILDTAPEPVFDDLTALASYICGTPIALVTLVDEDRQWLKSKMGTDVQETSREVSFCGHAILTDDLMVVEDARLDARFADNPLVTGDTSIRFYAGAPLTTSDGHAIGSLCVLDRVPRTLNPEQKRALRSLSRQVMAQMEHRRNTLELAEVIAERKQTEELKAAKHAAETADRTKAEFMANMSHELRTPLNGILGLTEVVLDSDLSREQREHLELVRDSAGTLLTLVSDILDFSEMELNTSRPASAGYSLRDCVGETVAAFSPPARDKGMTVRASVTDDIPDMVVGDAGRVRKVLGHLIGNAIKFSARGVIVVELRVEMVVRDGLLVHGAVADSGVGISPEQQLVIFDAFAQADGSATRRHGGVGIGLTIAARMVAQMGGRLWVDSELGTGSKFHFTFRQGLPARVSRPMSAPARVPGELGPG